MIRILVAALALVVGQGCHALGAPADERTAVACADDPEVGATLVTLERVRTERDRLLSTPGMKDAGELSGRVAALEETLARRGCPVRWDGRRYRLVAPPSR